MTKPGSGGSQQVYILAVSQLGGNAKGLLADGGQSVLHLLPAFARDRRSDLTYEDLSDVSAQHRFRDPGMPETASADSPTTERPPHGDAQSPTRTDA